MCAEAVIVWSRCNPYVENGQTFWSEETLGYWIRSSKDVALVASKRGILPGFLLASYHPLTSKATIENIYVHPHFRGQNIAGQLFKTAEDRLRKLNVDFVYGFVEPDNTQCIKALEKSGFEKGKAYYWMQKFLDKDP